MSLYMFLLNVNSTEIYEKIASLKEQDIEKVFVLSNKIYVTSEGNFENVITKELFEKSVLDMSTLEDY